MWPHLLRLLALSGARDKAHIRREWYKAAEESCAGAVWFIGQIRQLYLIEDETRDLSGPDRKTVRRQKAPALWRALKQRALALKANPPFLPQSSLGKAVKYFLNEYTAVVGCLRDGQFQIGIISWKTTGDLQWSVASAGSSSALPTPVGAVQ